VYKKLNSTGTLIQRTTTEAPQGHMYYIGLDVHKKTISYCVKDSSGQVHQEGQVGATRWELDGWMKTLPQPWAVAMEATIFTGWIYDHLLPHAQQVKVAHPLMLRAIAAAKKKNDRIDAGKIADCLRCDFLPECHMASTQIRDRRRTLRYRHLLVRQMVQMKNRISGLLMETGVSHNKRRLHKVGYFRELLASNEEVNESIRPLLRVSRDTIVRLQKTEYALVSSLQRDPLLAERIKRLRTVPGVGPITALTWALEMGEVSRFPSIREAISYCGLCGDEKSSADKVIRTPLSKQRNKHIQRVLVEAAKLAPRQDHDLALVYEREKQKGNANRATLAVARKMVAYLLAVDRGQRDFVPFADPRAQRPRNRRPRGEKTGSHSAQTARSRGCRLSDGDQTPEALFELFQDWQRTHTQSSVTVRKDLRQ
jgi:transposase